MTSNHTLTERNIPEHLRPQNGAPVMFENSVLERLSKISPLTVLLIYLPVIIWFLHRAWEVSGARTAALLALGGFVFWTLFEYVFHRTVFHFWPVGEFQTRLQFIIHGVHHRYPHDKERLVMPVSVSLLVAAILFWVFALILDHHVWGFAAGFLAGYLFYDMMHYSIHFFPVPKNALGRRIWRHHLAHHFFDAGNGFGVSTPIWDHVFGTVPRRGSRPGSG